MKFMLIPLLLPFVFVYHPAILAFPNFSVDMFLPILALLVATYHASVLLYGGIDGRYDMTCVTMMGAGLLTSVLWIFHSEHILLVISVALAVLGLVFQSRRLLGVQSSA